MNVSMNAAWATFKAYGIKCLGRAGFAEWLEFAASVVRAEAKREEANRAFEAEERRKAMRVVSPEREAA
jgi:hypothetical protein